MVENISPGVSARNARVVLFDFDGTLSVIRSGWMNVMVPMMVEILADLKTGESEEQLRGLVEEFVWKLTGKETIYQMIAFAEAIQARGGKPLEFGRWRPERGPARGQSHSQSQTITGTGQKLEPSPQPPSLLVA